MRVWPRAARTWGVCSGVHHWINPDDRVAIGNNPKATPSIVHLLQGCIRQELCRHCQRSIKSFGTERKRSRRLGQSSQCTGRDCRMGRCSAVGFCASARPPAAVHGRPAPFAALPCCPGRPPLCGRAVVPRPTGRRATNESPNNETHHRRAACAAPRERPTQQRRRAERRLLPALLIYFYL